MTDQEKHIMDCSEVRDWLAVHSRPTGDASDVARGARPDAPAEIRAHLDGCAACRHAAAMEAGLSHALDTRLTRHAAPANLRRRIEATIEAAASSPATASTSLPIASRPRRPFLAPFSLGFAAAAILAVATIPVLTRRPPPDTTVALVAEAVNDHLRVIESTHPMEVESGVMHQVRPWFTGRLEFTPRLAFSGDDDFPLIGGSLGYFRDRRAAVFVFKRRLHTITLFVMLVSGFEWPSGNEKPLGEHFRVSEQMSRGFATLFWRSGDLGYVLVSDTAPLELETLARKIEGN